MSTLSPVQTRRLTVVMVVLIFVLSAVATFFITRGWSNEDLQEQVADQENERRQAMPRLGD
ncbi:MAG: hypothetical protein AAF845_15205 [Bacteroidota bacterium]